MKQRAKQSPQRALPAALQSHALLIALVFIAIACVRIPIATALFTLLPPILAHAGLATTDMALTACIAAAFYAAMLWAESPTIKRAVLFGIAAASAALAKFTALIFFPAAMLLAVLAWWA